MGTDAEQANETIPPTNEVLGLVAQFLRHTDVPRHAVNREDACAPLLKADADAEPADSPSLPPCSPVAYGLSS